MIHDIFFAVMYNMCAVMGGIDYSVLPNKRAYARSCSRKKIPLCTNLLGTMHGPCTVCFGANFQKISKFKRLFLQKNVDNPPVILVTYVCIVIIHRC